jgi:hypothetical protein
MNSKQIFAGAAVATVLVLASPVYAGPLGGAGGLGGNLGGSLGGNLSGFGHPGGFGGAGAFGSQGGLNGSLDSPNTKPISKTTHKADSEAKSVPQARDSVAGSVTQATTGDANTSAAAEASKSVSAAPAPAAAAKPSTATAPAPAKRNASTALAGSADQSAAAGDHTFSGTAGGSLDAQHSRGSNSAAADGDTSTSLN